MLQILPYGNLNRCFEDPAGRDVLNARRYEEFTGGLGPPERRALREIAEHGPLTVIEGQFFLVAPVSAPTIDALAAFEAEGEDREDDLCDEPDPG